MNINSIKSKYEELEPIFFSDIEENNITKSAINQQIKKMCKQGLLAKYDVGIYYIPKKSLLNINLEPSADIVARYKYVSNGKDIYGYYTGLYFANKIGICTQVPNVIDIVSNKTNSNNRMIKIKKKRFYIKKPIVTITSQNVYTLQLLDLLKNIDVYMDVSIDEAKSRIAEYSKLSGITKKDIDTYIGKFPLSTFKNFYELEMYDVFAH